jgi:hypothetical protein
MQNSNSELKNLMIVTAAALLLPGRFKWMRRLRFVTIMAVWMRVWLNSPQANGAASITSKPAAASTSMNKQPETQTSESTEGDIQNPADSRKPAPKTTAETAS